MFSIHNDVDQYIQLTLHICRLPTADWKKIQVFIEKNLHISGCTEFRPVLFKGQLHCRTTSLKTKVIKVVREGEFLLMNTPKKDHIKAVSNMHSDSLKIFKERIINRYPRIKIEKTREINILEMLLFFINHWHTPTPPPPLSHSLTHSKF